MTRKILVVLTSYGPDSTPGGWYLPEFAHPYDEFTAAGYQVTVASPAGGEAPLDPGSVQMWEEDPSSKEFRKTPKLWEETEKISAYLGRADEFDALFYPGGHGPMFDLVSNADSQQLIAEFESKGKIVASVCHGPAAFLHVTRQSTGRPLLEGLDVTGFSNEEENAIGTADAMPFKLEDELEKVALGVVKLDPKAPRKKFKKNDKIFEPKVVTVGKVITGQNPVSARVVAQEIVKALGELMP
ncbi:DJ-1/PfpI family protein [Bombardia bombarda]|uniref:D-lactate dehydratase n=1 Tax=Bombardia bombarda TaxID=252184 RepID=A0AA39XME1_9PEZI|nr:DJ-1/PfpI family protein [Bombardia bombarda]